MQLLFASRACKHFSNTSNSRVILSCHLIKSRIFAALSLSLSLAAPFSHSQSLERQTKGHADAREFRFHGARESFNMPRLGMNGRLLRARACGSLHRGHLHSCIYARARFYSARVSERGRGGAEYIARMEGLLRSAKAKIITTLCRGWEQSSPVTFPGIMNVLMRAVGLICGNVSFCSGKSYEFPWGFCAWLFFY